MVPADPRPAGPKLAIVIPVYGHAALVGEALTCALGQQAPFDIHVVAVNDGCPQPETDLVLSAFARAHPDRMHYLRRPNGGLSAARNAGIEHVLAHLPSVEAIFMLDSDNRLRPTAMARAMARLQENPEAGWVYPGIDMFGIPARCDYSGPYSRLIHSAMNICEAGSLIRRRVFEAGLRFDESFTSGFEDWHFFLSAGDAGFRGVNLEEFGFFYRKRPESMLANADRESAALVARIQAAHPDLYRPATQLHLEQDEAPRYALWLADTDEIRLSTDPDRPGISLTPEAFVRLYWRSRTSPMRWRVPPFLVVTSTACLEALRQAGLLHWLLWRMECAALDGGQPPEQELICTRLAPWVRQPGLSALLNPTPGPALCDRAAVWMIGSGRLAGLLEGSAPPDPPAPENGALLLDLRAEHMPPPEPVTGGLRKALALIHASPFQTAGQRHWGWRQASIGWRGQEHRILRRAARQQPILPRVPGPGPEIALLAPDPASPGLAAALHRLQAARQGGGRLHLILLCAGAAPCESPLHDQVDSIALLGEDGFAARTDGPLLYQAIPLPLPARDVLDDRAIGLLCMMDAVHDTGLSGASRLMGSLRRLGVRTWRHLDLPPGPALDQALTLTLAYEHAYDHVLPGTARIAAQLRARGLPDAKLAPREALVPDPMPRPVTGDTSC